MKRILQAALGKFGLRLSRVANAPKGGLTSRISLGCPHEN
jgi:hypothetical protein